MCVCVDWGDELDNAAPASQGICVMLSIFTFHSIWCSVRIWFVYTILAKNNCKSVQHGHGLEYCGLRDATAIWRKLHMCLYVCTRRQWMDAFFVVNTVQGWWPTKANNRPHHTEMWSTFRRRRCPRRPSKTAAAWFTNLCSPVARAVVSRYWFATLAFARSRSEVC